MVYGYGSRRTLWAVFLAFAMPNAVVVAQEYGPELRSGEDGIVFVIGEFDGNRVEFQRTRWEGVKDLRCTVGVDCSAESLPLRIRAPSATQWDAVAVESITTNFGLAEDLESARLVLARAGEETIVLNLDGQEIGTLTHDEFGAGEGTIYGRLAIPLGLLDAGPRPHTLTLRVADDGIGNQRHSVDAIALLSTVETDG